VFGKKGIQVDETAFSSLVAKKRCQKRRREFKEASEMREKI
jgi:hypothetical protein